MEYWHTDTVNSPNSSYENCMISRESSWPTSTSLLDSREDLDNERMTAPNGGTAAEAQKTSLNLLDLPIDILEVVVREIGSTGDLTALALTHSVLHAIAIPQMYARFDIVWPDIGDETDLRVGVDALAFGLGTLAMSGSTFRPRGQRSLARRRVDNYAQFTRKFSLGDGPPKFVSSYYISTESGKMLGTLVALAIACMRNLESFIWDMPTGILRETWEALSSLGYDSDGHQTPSNLGSVWVRCHDSGEFRAASQNLHFFLPRNSLSARYDILRNSFRKIEHPNFSILPPLKSISVLCIDQIAYFEELSILLSGSLDRLRELRIGISSLSRLARMHICEDGREADETFMNEPRSTPLGANGVLGMLMSKICECSLQPVSSYNTQEADIRSPVEPFHDAKSVASEAPLGIPIGPIPSIVPGVPIGPEDTVQVSAPPEHTRPVPLVVNVPESQPTKAHSPIYPPPQKFMPNRNGSKLTKAVAKSRYEQDEIFKEQCDKHWKEPQKDQCLKLNILALEHVPLSISVLTKAIDWTLLTDITLLHCNSDEKLWAALSNAFPPRAKECAEQSANKTISTHDFPLRLKRVHTTGVSLELIALLRDDLAPNTLESLFLQDRQPYPPGRKVTINSIYRGPLRRHRKSIQKLSIDSGCKENNTGTTWKKWVLNQDALTFITSGKMPKLRELAISVDHSDWHFLLQHLPGLPHLRSLYVPYVNGYTPGVRVDAQEFALQILDIVTLRPEIELCYIGILNKCFEILEGKNAEAVADGNDAPSSVAPGSDLLASAWNNIPFLNHEESDTSSVSTTEDAEPEDAVEEEGESVSDAGESLVSEESEDLRPKPPRLRLREILFFAEKVEIFKVRNGRL